MKPAMKRLYIAAIICLLHASSFNGFAQRPAETVAEVPALGSFHEVIFKIWHQAWPQKNASMLRRLAPDVDKGITAVASARLPGILRDKKAAWEEGVKKLQSVGSEYKSAAASNDDTRLLAAAEELHGRFEALMRITRPPMRELDEFHAVLYMLYHHYLPQHETAKIRSSAVELKRKMAVLNSAELPERLKQKQKEFSAASESLSKSVEALQAAVQSGEAKTMEAAVEKLHTNYQNLAKVVE